LVEGDPKSRISAVYVGVAVTAEKVGYSLENQSQLDSCYIKYVNIYFI